MSEVSPGINSEEARGAAGFGSETLRPDNMTFLQTKSALFKLNRPGLSPEETQRKQEIERRRNSLVEEVKQTGALQPVFDDILSFSQRGNFLEDMSKSGELKRDHLFVFTGDIQKAIQSAREITRLEEEGDHKGIVEDVYVTGLTSVRKRVSHLEVNTQQSQEQATPKEDPEVKQAREDLAKIVADCMERQEISLSQMMFLYQQQTQRLTDLLRGGDPERERENWVDIEYRQEFWQRFEPKSWPKFYEEVSGKERFLWDARWQLARAAFSKKVTAALPDKYREIKDLELGKEQMEALYNMEGVKELLQGYTNVIIEGTELMVGSGNEVSIWDITDMDHFEEFRLALREKCLGSTDMSELEMKEADAVAWNLIWVGNLMESVDSRYSYSGTSHGHLPGNMMAGEYKYVLHPQERYESKCTSRHYWGSLANWGINQIDRIKEESGFDNKKGDEILFSPAKKGRYWTWKRRRDLDPSDSKNRDKGGRVIEVFAPECLPATSAKSFWEETKVEQKIRGRWEKKPLLDFVLEGEEIPWDEVPQDAWVIYMTGKFHKSFSIQEYFTGAKPFEFQKDGAAMTWAKPLIELYTRLGMDYAKFDKDIKAGKSYQSFTDLKRWAVIASLGGVKDVDNRKPTIRLSSSRESSLNEALKHRENGYFSYEENL